MNPPQFTPAVQAVMAGIVGLLLVASAVTWWLRRKGPAERYTELTQRVRSWWVMVAVFAVASLRVSATGLDEVGSASQRSPQGLRPAPAIDPGVIA